MCNKTKIIKKYMLFLLVPLHNLTDLNRLLSNNIATALYLGKSNIY